jgi:acetyl-CoA acyltransferase
MTLSPLPRRTAIVDGCRTPFAKARRELRHLTPLDLATLVSGQLAARNGLGAGQVGSLHLGSALAYPAHSFLARETAIGLGWLDTAASSAEYACATSLRTAIDVTYEIGVGEHDIGIAGGVESMSRVPIDVTDGMRHHLVSSLKAGPERRLEMLGGLHVRDLLPDPPSLTEPYSGVTLAEYAETLAGEWGVSRQDADGLTVRSHQRAAAAREAGHFDGQLLTLPSADGREAWGDTVIDPTVNLETLSGLRPLYPDSAGVITTGNASGVTDGAAAVLLASEEGCARNGLRPLAWIRSWAFTSHSPDVGVLLGPAFALPRALERAGLALADVGLLDIHEAFAGQVLANLAALDSHEFAKSHLDRDAAVGAVDIDRLNVWGGTLALGHPFGATGARLLTQLARSMAERGAQFGATALCVGGSRGAAVVLELAEG